jgi:hypothetical protein
MKPGSKTDPFLPSWLPAKSSLGEKLDLFTTRFVSSGLSRTDPYGCTPEIRCAPSRPKLLNHGARQKSLARILLDVAAGVPAATLRFVTHCIATSRLTPSSCSRSNCSPPPVTTTNVFFGQTDGRGLSSRTDRAHVDGGPARFGLTVPVWRCFSLGPELRLCCDALALEAESLPA